MNREELRADIQKAIEKYKEDNFWQIYPSGGLPRPWVIDFFTDYVEAMQQKQPKRNQQQQPVSDIIMKALSKGNRPTE